jgi:hypothetical protein
MTLIRYIIFNSNIFVSNNIPSQLKPKSSEKFNLACFSLKLLKWKFLDFEHLKIGSEFCCPKGLNKSKSFNNFSFTTFRSIEDS